MSKDLIRNDVNWGHLVVYTLVGIEFYVDSFYNGDMNRTALKELVPEEREIPEFNYHACIQIALSPAKQVYCYFPHDTDVRKLCAELSVHTGKEARAEAMGCILATYKDGVPMHAERSIKDFYKFATEEQIKNASLGTPT